MWCLRGVGDYLNTLPPSWSFLKYPIKHSPIFLFVFKFTYSNIAPVFLTSSCASIKYVSTLKKKNSEKIKFVNLFLFIFQLTQKNIAPVFLPSSCASIKIHIYIFTYCILIFTYYIYINFYILHIYIKYMFKKKIEKKKIVKRKL